MKLAWRKKMTKVKVQKQTAKTKGWRATAGAALKTISQGMSGSGLR